MFAMTTALLSVPTAGKSLESDGSTRQEQNTNIPVSKQESDNLLSYFKLSLREIRNESLQRRVSEASSGVRPAFPAVQRGHSLSPILERASATFARFLPIALYTAASSAERVAFWQIKKKTGSRLRQQLIDEETQQPVPSEDKGRGYEYAKGNYRPSKTRSLMPSPSKAVTRRHLRASRSNRRTIS
jgi:hypothetical protein